MLAIVVAVSAMQPPAAVSAEDVTVRAPPAAHAQNIEAFAAPDIQKSAPTAIVALSASQLRDPTFRPIANQLGAALVRQGFHLVRTGEAYRNVVTLRYEVRRDVLGDLPGQGTDDPRVEVRLGAAAFPTYRRLTVTAYAVKGRARPELLWRTVMAEDGFAYDVTKTIPELVEAGTEYFGRDLTALAVADCGAAARIGSHIPVKPCGEARARLNGDTVRRPEVTVGPLSTPSVSAPPRQR